VEEISVMSNLERHPNNSLGDAVSRSVDEPEQGREAQERVRFQAYLLAAVGQAVIATDPQGKILYWNRCAEDLYGWSAEEMIGCLLQETLVPEDQQPQAEEIMAELRARKSWSGEFVVRRKDGTLFPAEVTDTPVYDRDGNLIAIVGVSADVTERKEAEEALRRSEARLAEAQRIAHLGSWEWDLRTDEVWWSDETYRIYGFEPEAFVSTFEKLMEVVYPEDRHILEATLEDALHEAKPYDFEHRVLLPGGEVRWVHRHAKLVREEGGEPLKMIGTVHDLTERKSLEERLKHQALHDSLTDLPNRHLFLDRLGQALRRTRRRRGRKVAVLFMDLDGFKVVNDSLGHEVGDRLLVAVSERLKRCLRPEDTLARFGGDEFTVLLEDLKSYKEAVGVAKRITEELGDPFALGGRDLFASASIGIALGEAPTKIPGDLLQEADTAMYRAKDEGLGYRVFDPQMYEHAVRRLELESDLRRAVEAREFILHYQPIVNLQNDELWGFEALLRWEHPKRGLLGPSEFIPVAIGSSILARLNERILKEACRQAKNWQKARPGIPPLVVSVNLSARQLGRHHLPKTVERVLRETGLEADCLSLDVIETDYIETLNTATLNKLKAMGVGLSIDDFGTGYSSLSYLKRLPTDTLKVDQTFVEGLGEDVEDTAIVGMIIELAHTLGMKVIAEGVESRVQAEQLKEMGCELAQGYYFSKPLPPEGVPEFLAGEPA
jgi:diguanylate cyclase (GGDEF)-like protein/PAS domain S-box-containing protein